VFRTQADDPSGRLAPGPIWGPYPMRASHLRRGLADAWRDRLSALDGRRSRRAALAVLRGVKLIVTKPFEEGYRPDVYLACDKESEKILGQTFGMCVLQDFEALTPNLLARTIERAKARGQALIGLLPGAPRPPPLPAAADAPHSGESARWRWEGRTKAPVLPSSQGFRASAR
jgi:hypothetical protein